MTLFPMFLKLERRSCLVVGAGTIGEPKIQSLLVAGANVQVIAPQARQAVMDWASAGLIVWEPRAFLPNDLEGVFLVIAATASAELNQLVFNEAQRRNILCAVANSRSQFPPEAKVPPSPKDSGASWKNSSPPITPAGWKNSEKTEKSCSTAISTRIGAEIYCTPWQAAKHLTRGKRQALARNGVPHERQGLSRGRRSG